MRYSFQQCTTCFNIEYVLSLNITLKFRNRLVESLFIKCRFFERYIWLNAIPSKEPLGRMAGLRYFEIKNMGPFEWKPKKNFFTRKLVKVLPSNL